VVFAEGRFEQESERGRHLIAHELAHVVQQSPGTLRREVTVPASCKAIPPHDPTGLMWPKVGVEVEFGRLYLTENRDQLNNLVWHLIAFGHEAFLIRPGIEAAVSFARRVSFAASVGTRDGGVCDPDAGDYEICLWRDKLKKVAGPLEEVAEAAYQACKNMLDCFHEAVRINAYAQLAENEREANAEKIKYGIKIDAKTYEAIDYSSGYASEIEIVKYSMDPTSPGAAGLAKAAGFLLKQREKVWAKLELQNQHAYIDPNSGYVSTDKEYDELGKAVDAQKVEYNKSRSVIIAMFPVLAQFSEIGQSDKDLRKIAETAPGDDIARLVGGKIHDTLKNIKKSRADLDSNDINLWRLEPMVDLTKAQFGGETDPVLMRLVEQKVHQEEPGVLASIALLFLNIAAILLAPATGGLSLAFAAGVNLAVTAAHVEEYLQQSALAGSALNKAKALSHDEPSLFWLAFEVVGTVFDVATAAVTVFKTLGPLVKAAVAAKGGKEAAEALEAVRIAARDAELGERVVEKIGALRKGEKLLVEGAEEESKLILEVEELATTEAKQEIGTALETAAGEVHVSDAGHVFSCASPCTELGAKYAEIFGADEKLAGRLADIQKDAEAAAALKKEAQAAAGAEKANKLAESEELADKVKKATKTLEDDIAAAHPEVAAAKAEQAAAATQVAIEGAGYELPVVLETERIAAATAKLRKGFPAFAKLSDGAIERILRAGYALDEAGKLRPAIRWASRVRGQLLEELAAVRVRNLLGSASGRAALGLEKEAGDLIFVEGSRIRSAGRQLTDGMIVRRVGDRIEVVAVLESKAGKWAASKLTESIEGLKHMSAADLLDGLEQADAIADVAKIDASLAPQLNPKAIKAMTEAERDAFRVRVVAAMKKMPTEEYRAIRDMMQKEGGQIGLNIERLLTEDERTVEIALTDAAGEATNVTAEIPRRPRFLGAAPAEVDLGKAGTTMSLEAASKHAGLEETLKGTTAKLRAEGFDFAQLDLGELGMTTEDLKKVSEQLIEALGPEFMAAKNAGIK
jgi:hypothetical protein